MVRPEVRWWLVFGLFMLQQSDGCDERVNISPCTCSLVPVKGQTKIKVDCSGQGLKSVPSNLPQRTAILDFSNNSLQTSHVKTLCRYADLENVSIANNDLRSITPGSLRFCENTKSVNLSGNILDVVDNDTFDGLDFTDTLYGLESLEFKDHAVSTLDLLRDIEIVTYQSSIPVNLFSGSKLNTLSLGIRGATEVPAAIFQPISETLTKLFITSTSVQSLNEKLLLNMKSLRDIELHLNLVQSLPVNLFHHSYLYNSLVTIKISGVKHLQRNLFKALESLRHLAIYGAYGMSADLFNGLLGLETLDLSGYSLIFLPSKWFYDLRRLKELVLCKTGLSKVTSKDFLHLKQLQTLDLSSNSIAALQPELFYEISSNVLLIDLSYNNLKVFPTGLFNQEAALVELNLSSNKIKSVGKGSFNNLTNLRRLYLQGNTLYNLEADTFINNVNIAFLDLSFNILIDLPARLFESTRNLTDLDLSNNRINKLEQSINFYVPSLRIINVSYNPIECDCKTVQVRDRLSHVILIGDCAKPQPGIAISDFLPETNCSTIDENDIDIFDANVSSPVDYIHPSESIVDAPGLDKQVIKEVNSTSYWTEASQVRASITVIPTEHLEFSEIENETKHKKFTTAVERSEKSEDNLVADTYEHSSEPTESNFSSTYYLNATTQNSESSELQPTFTAYYVNATTQNSESSELKPSFTAYNVNATTQNSESSEPQPSFTAYYVNATTQNSESSELQPSFTAYNVNATTQNSESSEPQPSFTAYYVNATTQNSESSELQPSFTAYNVNATTQNSESSELQPSFTAYYVNATIQNSESSDLQPSVNATTQNSESSELQPSYTAYYVNSTTQNSESSELQPSVNATTQNSESSELQPSFTAVESVQIGSDSSLDELEHTLRSTIIQNTPNADKDHGNLSISPTRAVTEELEGNMMAEENRGVVDVISTEVTKSPFVERSLNNVTSQLEKEISKEKESEYFHISLAAIISVAVISLLILVFLYCKRRRSTEYEVTNNNFGCDSPATVAYYDGRSQLAPLKEVPSIQIESVDDEGNTRVEMYPLAQTNDTWKT